MSGTKEIESQVQLSDTDISYLLIALRRMRDGFMLDLEVANAFRLTYDTSEVNFLNDRLKEITPLIIKLEHHRDARNNSHYQRNIHQLTHSTP